MSGHVLSSWLAHLTAGRDQNRVKCEMGFVVSTSSPLHPQQQGLYHQARFWRMHFGLTYVIFQSWSKWIFPQYCMNKEQENNICVLCRKREQETRRSFYFTQCTAELYNIPLPEASAVLLTTGKQRSSPGLLQPVKTRLCLSYRLEIKVRFNVWHLLSSQYIFSSWALIDAGLRDMETHDMYQIHSMEPSDF